MKICYMFSLLMLCLLFQPLATLGQTKQIKTADVIGKVYWQTYLYYVCVRNDGHCTLEVSYHPDEDPFLYRPYIRDDSEPRSLEESIAKLSREVPGFEFRRNERNPKIIHAIDKRLLKLDDYDLDEEVDFEYSGVLGELSRALQRKLPAIGPKTSGLVGEVFDDHVTETEVRAKGETVRQILTEAAPPKGYGPILWRAETTISEGEAKTTVQFYGPNRIPESRRERIRQFKE